MLSIKSLELWLEIIMTQTIQSLLVQIFLLPVFLKFQLEIFCFLLQSFLHKAKAGGGDYSDNLFE